MINEISVNSNNTIELSRGELLCWLNERLGVNVSKIQMLGTGAVYCQLLHELYPNEKVPLSKVNFKAKSEYEYINNFKVLQQCFTKYGITRHIDVERLIKCKYQDNLEFLQWFKKIFNKTGDSDARQSVSQVRDKENKMAASRQTVNSANNSSNEPLTEIVSKQSFNRENVSRGKLSQSDAVKNQGNPLQSHAFTEKEEYYSPSKGLQTSLPIVPILPSQNYCHIDERNFYRKKLKEIEHLLQFWDYEKSSHELASQVRTLMLIPPSTKGFYIDEITGEVKIVEEQIKAQSKQNWPHDESQEPNTVKVRKIEFQPQNRQNCNNAATSKQNSAMRNETDAINGA